MSIVVDEYEDGTGSVRIQLGEGNVFIGAGLSTQNGHFVSFNDTTNSMEIGEDGKAEDLLKTPAVLVCIPCLESLEVLEGMLSKVRKSLEGERTVRND